MEEIRKAWRNWNHLDNVAYANARLPSLRKATHVAAREAWWEFAKVTSNATLGEVEEACKGLPGRAFEDCLHAIKTLTEERGLES